MRKLFCKISLVVILGFFTHNTAKGMWLLTAKYTIPALKYGAPVAFLTVYALYKEFKKRSTFTEVKNEIHNLRRQGNRNFVSIENSKKDLLTKIELVKEALKLFIDKRITGSERKLIAVLGLTKSDILEVLDGIKKDFAERLDAIKSQVGRCSTKGDIAALDRSLQLVFSEITVSLSKTNNNIKGLKKDIEKLRKEIHVSSKNQNQFVENKISYLDKRNQKRHDILRSQNSAEFGNLVAKIGNLENNVAEMKSLMQEMAIKKGKGSAVATILSVKS